MQIFDNTMKKDKTEKSSKKSLDQIKTLNNI